MDFANQPQIDSAPEILLLQNIDPGGVSGNLGANKGSQLPISLQWPSVNILWENYRRHVSWIRQGWTKGLPSRQLQLPIPRKAQHLEHDMVKSHGRRSA